MKVNQCISCGNTGAKKIALSEAFIESINEKKFTQPAYSIVQCDNCGLYYKDHVLDTEVLNDYYNSFDFKVWTPITGYPTENIVERYLSSKMGLDLFDYGCSEGRFISKFTAKNKCYGYDIDQRALKIAAQKGINILTHDDLDLSKNKFDVIILSDVFEHSMKPTKLILFLLSMLRKNGVLIISTGYADAKACKYDLAHFWYFRTVQHVCMLGDDYIHYLQNKLKVNVLKKIQSSHYKVSFKTKLFYSSRFELFKFIDSNRTSMMVKLMSKVPYLKKVTKWKDQPYYPYSKDHLVLFLQNVNNLDL